MIQIESKYLLWSVGSIDTSENYPHLIWHSPEKTDTRVGFILCVFGRKRGRERLHSIHASHRYITIYLVNSVLNLILCKIFKCLFNFPCIEHKRCVQRRWILSGLKVNEVFKGKMLQIVLYLMSLINPYICL